jgi:hypothetical protein
MLLLVKKENEYMPYKEAKRTRYLSWTFYCYPQDFGYSFVNVIEIYKPYKVQCNKGYYLVIKSMRFQFLVCLIILR